MLNFHRLRGAEARPFASSLAELRLNVFFSFPYLYEGTLDYERNYLETYFRAQNSFLFLVEDQGKIVGASTGIHAVEEEETLRRPFMEYGIDPASVFYLGESVLLQEYRGRGLGKLFFQEREAFARSLTGISTLSFCAVERPFDHPLCPADYRPLDTFWTSMGFHLEPGLYTDYEWRDRGETLPTKKRMNYWLKYIGSRRLHGV